MTSIVRSRGSSSVHFGMTHARELRRCAEETGKQLSLSSLAVEDMGAERERRDCYTCSSVGGAAG